ncbi:ribonuclease H protein [Trifolium medium]|uniref:Ribonuclease H protein n=1 Tax=Trifolium medium TaxID=97028 RepID=A0A392M480_9FABA|nr:ribonuclease H protein [Trifolium medium]
MSTWKPLLEHLRKMVNSWGNKYISLGGRLVLLNPILNFIPIFFMPFLKLPIQMVKKVIRIQREFLWGGVNAEKKLCWLKWNVVCQEKSKDGLGVRDVRVMNLSLLAKWWWRLLQSNHMPLWKQVLIGKYVRFNHTTRLDGGRIFVQLTVVLSLIIGSLGCSLYLSKRRFVFPNAESSTENGGIGIFVGGEIYSNGKSI